MPDGDRCDFTVIVNDEIGHKVLRVKPSLVLDPLPRLNSKP